MLISSAPEIEIFTARSGHPSARIKFSDGRSLLLHSAYDPVREARNLVANSQLKEAKIIILLGVGLGYSLVEVAKQTSTYVEILAIEKHKLLVEWVYQNLKELPWSRITLTAAEEDIKSFIFTHREELSGQGVIVLEHPPSIRTDPDFYSKMRTRIRDYFSLLLIELNTARDLNHFIHRNLLQNFPRVIGDPGINSLKNTFNNRPAVIVAAGPSLAKNVDLLSRAKGRGVLICVGTALKALQKKGIEPDLVVTLDPTLANYRLFENMAPSQAFLCYEPQTYPDVLTLFPEKRFVFDVFRNYLGLWLRSLYGAKGELAPGGSVAIAAFELACFLGANPIVFIGQDLAYTNGFTHARGTHYDGQKADLDSPHVLQVPAIGGGMVYTSRALHGFLVRFEELFQKHSDRLIIDATEGGAIKRGTKIMSFREALDQYFLEKIPVLQRIEEIHDRAQPPAELVPGAIKEIERTIEEYQDFISRLDELNRQATMVQKLNDAAMKPSCGNNGDFWARAAGESLKEKALELNQLLKEVNSCSKLIDLLGLLTVEVGLSRALPEDATLSQQLERIRDFYGRYHGAARAMVEQLEELLEKLVSLSRGNEENAPTGYPDA